MRRGIRSVWGCVLAVSLVYYALFFLFMLFGVIQKIDAWIPSGIQRSLREILSFGMILFWIFLILVPLGLTGVIKIPKKQFLFMSVLVALTVVLFILSEVG